MDVHAVLVDHLLDLVVQSAPIPRGPLHVPDRELERNTVIAVGAPLVADVYKAEGRAAVAAGGVIGGDDYADEGLCAAGRGEECLVVLLVLDVAQRRVGLEGGVRVVPANHFETHLGHNLARIRLGDGVHLALRAGGVAVAWDGQAYGHLAGRLVEGARQQANDLRARDVRVHVHQDHGRRVHVHGERLLQGGRACLAWRPVCAARDQLEGAALGAAALAARAVHNGAVPARLLVLDHVALVVLEHVLEHPLAGGCPHLPAARARKQRRHEAGRLPGRRRLEHLELGRVHALLGPVRAVEVDGALAVKVGVHAANRVHVATVLEARANEHLRDVLGPAAAPGGEDVVADAHIALWSLVSRANEELSVDLHLLLRDLVVLRNVHLLRALWQGLFQTV
mmetsp:Transcript_1222/g.4390  ORF Transcript_1222/g.4390 Transcript_1222/m.4390 type:complete len:396 (-) Transcript_1222:1234-2421(-)